MSDRLSPVDAAWLHMEEPTDPMTVVAVLTFAAPVDWTALLGRLDTRVVRPYRRFRQRIVDVAVGAPRWEDEPDFTLASHVHRAALPAPGDRAALAAFVSDRVGTPLDLRFSPWSADLVEGYGAGAALLVRIHHSVADGMALAHILLEMADTPVPRASVPRPPRRPGVSLAQGAAAVEAVRKLLLTPADAPSRLKGPLGRVKRVGWTDPVALERVKARGRALGGTVNDVLTAAVAGGLRAYLLSHADAARDLRAFVPVDLRGGDLPDVSLGNRFGLVYLDLPVSEPDPAARVRRVAERMAAIKHTPEAAVAYGILATMGALPAPIEHVGLDIFGAKGTIVLTNVRGPAERVVIAGHPVDELLFWVPQSGHLGVGVSLLSYAGAVRVGVSADAGLVPDPERLARAIQAELGG